MITYDLSQFQRDYGCRLVSVEAIVVVVTTKKGFLAFRVSPDLKNEIQAIAENEARSISQVCELLLSEGVQAYKKEGPKFIQRLVAKQTTGSKES
jgi:hypothetical protein